LYISSRLDFLHVGIAKHNGSCLIFLQVEALNHKVKYPRIAKHIQMPHFTSSLAMIYKANSHAN